MHHRGDGDPQTNRLACRTVARCGLICVVLSIAHLAAVVLVAVGVYNGSRNDDDAHWATDSVIWSLLSVQMAVVLLLPCTYRARPMALVCTALAPAWFTVTYGACRPPSTALTPPRQCRDHRPHQ